MLASIATVKIIDAVTADALGGGCLDLCGLSVAAFATGIAVPELQFKVGVPAVNKEGFNPLFLVVAGFTLLTEAPLMSIVNCMAAAALLTDALVLFVDVAVLAGAGTVGVIQWKLSGVVIEADTLPAIAVVAAATIAIRILPEKAQLVVLAFFGMAILASVLTQTIVVRSFCQLMTAITGNALVFALPREIGQGVAKCIFIEAGDIKIGTLVIGVAFHACRC